jgi:hypothetical protein
LFVPVFIHTFSRSAEPGILPAKGRLFAKCWFIAGIIFLSIASTKRTLYLMPIFAPIAILTSLYIQSTISARATIKTSKTFLWALTFFLALVGVCGLPLYAYIKDIYPSLGNSTALFVSVTLLSVIMMTFSFWAAWHLHHGAFNQYWALTYAPIIAGLVFVAVIVTPFMDRHKSFVPFCRDVMAIVPAREPLYAYSPDETLRGAVPFYTGRYLTEIHTLTNMEQKILSGEQFFIITRDKKMKAEKELLSSGILSIVFQKKMGVDRTLTLFSSNISNNPVKSMPLHASAQ